MRRFIISFALLSLLGTLTLAPLAGCKSKSDAPPATTPEQSGVKPSPAPTVPPQVQIGPPK